jgi:Flp pilus assembly protein TadG
MRVKEPRYGLRARERGAALVEACVVVPVFIVLFAGMLFLHQVVQKTQQAQLGARSAAWTEAMKTCSGGAEITEPDVLSRMDGAAGSSVSLTATSGDATGSKDDYASVSVLGAGPAAVSESSAGPAFFQPIHSRAIVMCNATTEQGRIPDVFRWFATRDDLSLLIGML